VTDGSFYGTTAAGGSIGYGIVFKITSNGNLTVLHNFTGSTDGANTVASPVEGTDGNFYGLRVGKTLTGAPAQLYKITPPAL